MRGIVVAAVLFRHEFGFSNGGGQMQKLLHEIEDARRMLSIGRTKFYQEVAAGNLCIVKSGKKSLVPQSSLDSFVARKIAEAQSGGVAA